MLDTGTGFTNITDLDLKGSIAPPAWLLRRMVPKESTEGFRLLTKACCDRSRWPPHLLAQQEASPVM